MTGEYLTIVYPLKCPNFCRNIARIVSNCKQHCLS